MESLQTEQLPDRDFAVVAAGLYTHRQATRPVEGWGLGEDSYVTEVPYPDRNSMDAAERPLGFGVALGAGTVLRTVEMTPTGEQGQ